MPKFLDYLIEEGYRVVEKRPLTQSGANCHESISEIVKFGRSDRPPINLMIISMKSSLTAVFKTYGSHLSNAITGTGIFCAHPHLMLEHSVIINNSRVPNFFYSAPEHFQRSVVKYAKRGFQFQPNPILTLSVDHECKHSTCCPHTRRNIFDKGCLTICTTDAELPNAFVSNSMQLMWQGHYGNVWAFGGDPCNLGIEPPCAIGDFMWENKIK
jgi:hypothetical protein